MWPGILICSFLTFCSPEFQRGAVQLHKVSVIAFLLICACFPSPFFFHMPFSLRWQPQCLSWLVSPPCCVGVNALRTSCHSHGADVPELVGAGFGWRAVVYMGDLHSLADGSGGGAPVAVWTSLSNKFNGYFASPTTSVSTATEDGLHVTTRITTERLLQVKQQRGIVTRLRQRIQSVELVGRERVM
jgi:hypothetical protein